MKKDFDFKRFIDMYVNEVMEEEDVYACGEEVIWYCDSEYDTVKAIITESESKHLEIGFAMGFNVACSLILGSRDYVVNIERP